MTKLLMEKAPHSSTGSSAARWLIRRLEQAEREKAELVEVCQTSRDLLQPVLVEPGRTVFWLMVDVLAKHGGEAVK